MFYVIDDNNNKVEALDKEGMLALLEQAIENGNLRNVASDSAFVTKLKCCVNNGTFRIAFITQAKYNELVANNQLLTNAYYIILDDTTCEDIDTELEELNERIAALENLKTITVNASYYEVTGIVETTYDLSLINNTNYLKYNFKVSNDPKTLIFTPYELKPLSLTTTYSYVYGNLILSVVKNNLTGTYTIGINQRPLTFKNATMGQFATIDVTLDWGKTYVFTLYNSNTKPYVCRTFLLVIPPALANTEMSEYIYNGQSSYNCYIYSNTDLDGNYLSAQISRNSDSTITTHLDFQTSTGSSSTERFTKIKYYTL